METKFNFKSSVCTSREQSERLLALGLKKETADMYLQSVLNDEWSPFVPIAFPYSDRPEEIIAPDVVNAIPAWSLHRLWELTPKVIFTKPSLYLTMYGDSVVYCAEDNNEEYEKSFSRQISLFDNIIDCIEWLIKEGYFNEEYLERKE